MARYVVYVTYKTGIFDPPGATAQRALVNMGYCEVGDVRIGKYITLDVAEGTSEDRVRAMCEKLLANPVIEDFRIEKAEG